MQEMTDVLVLGSGLSGCITAYCLAQEGVEVTLVTNADPLIPSFSLTQEGILYPDGGEDFESVIQDLMQGEDVQFQPAIQHLLHQGKGLVDELLLQQFQLPFQKMATGSWLKELSGNQSKPRCLLDHDHTEKTIYEAFLNALLDHPHVRFLPKHSAIELLTFSHHSQKRADVFHQPTCFGAYVLNEETGDCFSILSKEVVLATGGIGQLFSHTTNSPLTFGSGLGMAAKAGVRLIQMDQLFFHPTSFFSSDEARFPFHTKFLDEDIEILTHRGAPLLEHGQAFSMIHQLMDAYSSELSQGAGKHFWYDLTHLDSERIRQRYPMTYEYCLTKGFDMTKKSLPMVPAQHFFGGGVAVDVHGRTSMHRLHAVGQVASSGVHGVAFDESVYLLESLVWGVSCAKDIAKHLEKFLYSFPPIREPSYSEEPIDPSLVLQDQEIIQRWMWQAIGIHRHPIIQQRACHILRELKEQIDGLYGDRKPTRASLNVSNGIVTAMQVLRSCLQKKSRIANTTARAQQSRETSSFFPENSLING